MQIYIAEGTQQTGPFDLDTIREGLRTGRYQSGQLAWYEGAAGWEPISKLPGLEAATPPPATPPAPPSPPPPPSTPAPPSYSPAPPAPGTYTPPPYSSAPPPPYSSAPPAPTNPYGAAAPPPKKGFWAKVGTAILGVLIFIGGVAKIFFAPSRHHYSYSSPSYHSTPTPASRSTPTPTSTPAPTVSASNTSTPTPAASSSRSATTTYSIFNYHNLLANTPNDARRTYFVGFQFNYSNFFDLKSGPDVEYKEDFVELVCRDGQIKTQSIYFDGYHSGSNSVTAASVLPTFGPKYIAGIEQSFRKQFPDLRAVSQGMSKVRNYWDAYDYQAQASATYNGRPTKFLLRYIMTAPRTGSNGIVIEMASFVGVADVNTPADLGMKGPSGGILQTFSFD